MTIEKSGPEWEKFRKVGYTPAERQAYEAGRRDAAEIVRRLVAEAGIIGESLMAKEVEP